MSGESLSLGLSSHLTHTHRQTDKHTHTHRCIHKHIHTHTHTHTHTLLECSHRGQVDLGRKLESRGWGLPLWVSWSSLFPVSEFLLMFPAWISISSLPPPPPPPWNYKDWTTRPSHTQLWRTSTLAMDLAVPIFTSYYKARNPQ